MLFLSAIIFYYLSIIIMIFIPYISLYLQYTDIYGCKNNKKKWDWQAFWRLFSIFLFFSGKWQEVTSIDSPKIYWKHRLSHLFLSLTTIWLSTYIVWWPSSDEPHQLFLLLCWKWLLITITVPFSERCMRGYMGRYIIYISI